MEKKVSYFTNTYDKKSTLISIENILQKIKEGFWANDINKLRDLYLKQEYDEYAKHKFKLPAVTFSAIFGEQRKLDFLIEYSGILIFDVDNLDKEQCLILMEKLSKDDYIYANWISPSGAGIKFLVIADTKVENHKIYFKAAKSYFEKEYHILIDKSGSDVTRLCYVSYDSQLTIKKSKILNSEFLKYLPLEKEIPSKTSNVKVSNILAGIEKNKNGKNKQADRELIQKIIRYLKKSCKSITSTYDDWYRVALAIANTFTIDIGEKYYLQICRLDAERHDEDKSKWMLQYCYNQKIEGKIRINTIVFMAQKQGFELSKMSSKKK